MNAELTLTAKAEAFSHFCTEMLRTNDLIEKFTGLTGINRIVSQPEPAVTLIEPITTRILTAPRTGKFTKGEVLTLIESTREQYSVEFIKRDGDRSFIKRNGEIVSCFTYKLRR